MRKRTRTLLQLGLVMLVAAQGCAHRRQSYYPEDFGSGRNVQVRAPFVNVQVRGRNRLENEPKLVGYDDEKEEREKRRERDDDRD